MATKKPTQWSIPRETKEWIGPVTFTPNDATLQLAILPEGQRPVEADWKTPDSLGGGLGLILDQPDPGMYYYWARLADSPEVPVIEAFGVITVT